MYYILVYCAIYYEKEHAYFPLKSLWLRSKEEGFLPSQEIDPSFLRCKHVKKSCLKEINLSCM